MLVYKKNSTAVFFLPTTAPFHLIETTKPPSSHPAVGHWEAGDIHCWGCSHWRDETTLRMITIIIYSSSKHVLVLASQMWTFRCFVVVYIIVSWTIRQNRRVYLSHMDFFPLRLHDLCGLFAKHSFSLPLLRVSKHGWPHRLKGQTCPLLFQRDKHFDFHCAGFAQIPAELP